MRDIFTRSGSRAVAKVPCCQINGVVGASDVMKLESRWRTANNKTFGRDARLRVNHIQLLGKHRDASVVLTCVCYNFVVATAFVEMAVIGNAIDLNPL